LKEKIMRFLLLYIGLWMGHIAQGQARMVHVVVALCDNVNQGIETVRTKAAEAYHLYQKCSIKGARNLLVTGFEL
jgi:hypothetical protein